MPNSTSYFGFLALTTPNTGCHEIYATHINLETPQTYQAEATSSEH